MKTINVHTRVASLVIALVFLFHISPTLAGGQATAQDAMTQGSRFPGWALPSTNPKRSKYRGPVDITFTKWITEVVPAPAGDPLPKRILMAGFTENHIPNNFAGEVLQRQVSSDGRVIRLEAIYDVRDGDLSFTALIRGGTGATSDEPASVSGAGLLDGVILAGWRTGAHVHVAFQTTTNCPGAPDARTCFQGTIHVEPVP
jgi:hypothetical protein